MKMPKYFIWRLHEEDPWRIYKSANHFRPSYPPDLDSSQPIAWEGDDYHDALAECSRLNRFQNGKTIIE